MKQRQGLLHAAAAIVGVGAGVAAPGLASRLEVLIWPMLAVTLYAMFLQLRPETVPQAIRKPRYTLSLLAGQFLLVPGAIFLFLLLLEPEDPVIRFALVLVLLAPCTDWFMTFSHSGRAGPSLATATAPLLLGLQLVLIPFYLWLFFRDDFIDLLQAGPFPAVFAGVILAPLLLALMTRRSESTYPAAKHIIKASPWLPVPALTATVFLVAASQTPELRDSLYYLGPALCVFAIYLLGVPLAGLALGGVFRLRTGEKRTLILSLATRNSHLVLPFAFAMPHARELAAAIIVLQLLIELVSMPVFAKAIPNMVPRTEKQEAVTS